MFGISKFFYVYLRVMVMWPLFGTLHGPISAKCLVTNSPD